jgi:glycolate oxidase subunit GlcD
MRPSPLETKLRRIIQRGKVMTARAQLLAYDADALGYKSFPPDAVVIPASCEELIDLLKNAAEFDVPIIMRGAGTSLSGGPVAAQGGIVVHTSALRNIRHIDVAGMWCEVECSCTLKQLDAALLPHGLFYPPDPSSGPVCTLGGNVAMNAGGAHCFRFGVTSNYVLGVEAVMLDGSVHRFGGPAGGRGPYREDWKRLMIGSEGTLAAFTRIWLRLLPRPEKEWTFQASFATLASAEKAIHALVAHSSYPVAIELMDPRFVQLVENSPMAAGLPQDKFLMVTEIDGPRSLVDHRVEQVKQLLADAGAEGIVYSDDAQRRQKLWKARKVAGGLMGQLSPDLVVQDAVIPKRSLADVLEMIYREADAVSIPVINVFHAGDGNLHPNFMFDSRNSMQMHQVESISKRLMRKVIEVGGTLSGEHGIGNDKTAYMPLVFGPHATRLQMATATAFDPTHKLNPLKMFAQREFAQAPIHSPELYHPELPIDRERLFEPFLDSIDGIALCDAAATWQEIQDAGSVEGLRFPLLLDPNATLLEHFFSSGYAPASSRFGPFCDNILGMNWRLPSGEMVRIGERVAKTTTGYDLLRFLLQSRGDFGIPEQFVVRYRSAHGENFQCDVAGDPISLCQLGDVLSHSCWIHWFDSVDVLYDPADGRWSLRLLLNAPADEWQVAEDFIYKQCQRLGLSGSSKMVNLPPSDGLPDLSFKTTRDHALYITQDIVRNSSIKISASCHTGAILFYSVDQPLINRLADSYRASILERGGELHSRHWPLPSVIESERHWFEVLSAAFHFSGANAHA